MTTGRFDLVSTHKTMFSLPPLGYFEASQSHAIAVEPD